VEGTQDLDTLVCDEEILFRTIMVQFWPHTLRKDAKSIRKEYEEVADNLQKNLSISNRKVRRSVYPIVHRELIAADYFLAHTHCIDLCTLPSARKLELSRRLEEELLHNVLGFLSVDKWTEFDKDFLRGRFVDYLIVNNGRWAEVLQREDAHAKEQGRDKSMFTAVSNMWRTSLDAELLQSPGVWFNYATSLCTAFCVDGIRRILDFPAEYSNMDLWSAMGITSYPMFWARVSTHWNTKAQLGVEALRIAAEYSKEPARYGLNSRSR
jgi:hypothetical protein